MSTVHLVQLSHDLIRKRSLALLVWVDDPEKKISIPVPFGCTLDEVRLAAETAVRDLSRDIATVAIVAP